jgi:hypothetical protein
LEAFSTFTKEGMRGSDEPEDKEAVEVTTYDSSKFKEFRPASLAVDEDRRLFLEQTSKVRGEMIFYKFFKLKL